MNEIDKLAFAIADTISGALDDIDADEFVDYVATEHSLERLRTLLKDASVKEALMKHPTIVASLNALNERIVQRILRSED